MQRNARGPRQGADLLGWNAAYGLFTKPSSYAEEYFPVLHIDLVNSDGQTFTKYQLRFFVNTVKTHFLFIVPVEIIGHEGNMEQPFHIIIFEPHSHPMRHNRYDSALEFIAYPIAHKPHPHCFQNHPLRLICLP